MLNVIHKSGGVLMQIIKSVLLIYSIFTYNDSTDQNMPMYLCLD